MDCEQKTDDSIAQGCQEVTIYYKRALFKNLHALRPIIDCCLRPHIVSGTTGSILSSIFRGFFVPSKTNCMSFCFIFTPRIIRFSYLIKQFKSYYIPKKIADPIGPDIFLVRSLIISFANRTTTCHISAVSHI